MKSRLSEEDMDYIRKAAERGETCQVTAQHVGVGAGWLAKLRTRMGIVNQIRPTRRAIPSDLAEQAAELNIKELCALYVSSPRTIRRWLQEAGVTQRQTPRQPGAPVYYRDFPEDWYEMMPRFSQTEACVYWKMSHRTVKSLCARSGLTPRPPKTGTNIPNRTFGYTHPLGAPMVPADQVAQAAHYLRKFYRNVHRADILMYDYVSKENQRTWGELRGAPDKGVGYYWVDMLGYVANNDVIEIARNKGWEMTVYA